MLNHRQLISDALAAAQERLHAGVSKTASAPSTRRGSLVDLKKEASEVANALEYVAYTTANDGSAQGTATTEMIRDFFKKATGKDPVVTETLTSGTQGQAPEHGKKKMPITSPSADRPEVTESPEGKGSREIGAQNPPETKTPPKQANMSLYDILNSNRAKEAASGDPAVTETGTNAPKIPSSNENVNRHAALDTAAGMTNLTKREAKLPTRKRLRDLFDSATDVTSDESARAIWPNAAAKGGLKVAGVKTAEVNYHYSMMMNHPEANHPEALAYANELLAAHAKKLYGKEVADLSEEEWAHSYTSALANPSMGKKMDEIAARKKATEHKSWWGQKKASGSLAEYSNLWDLAISGNLGEEPQKVAAAIVEQIEGK